MSVTLPMPRVTYLRRPAHSGWQWLQGVLTGIGLQQGGPAVCRVGLAAKPLVKFNAKISTIYADVYHGTVPNAWSLNSLCSSIISQHCSVVKLYAVPRAWRLIA